MIICLVWSFYYLQHAFSPCYPSEQEIHHFRSEVKLQPTSTRWRQTRASTAHMQCEYILYCTLRLTSTKANRLCGHYSFNFRIQFVSVMINTKRQFDFKVQLLFIQISTKLIIFHQTCKHLWNYK